MKDKLAEFIEELVTKYKEAAEYRICESSDNVLTELDNLEKEINSLIKKYKEIRG